MLFNVFVYLKHCFAELDYFLREATRNVKRTSFSKQIRARSFCPRRGCVFSLVSRFWIWCVASASHELCVFHASHHRAHLNPNGCGWKKSAAAPRNPVWKWCLTRGRRRITQHMKTHKKTRKSAHAKSQKTWVATFCASLLRLAGHFLKKTINKVLANAIPCTMKHLLFE